MAVLRKHFNVASFVETHFPTAILNAAGTEYVAHCPWHESNKRKLYISASSGIYNCFSCEAHGSFFSLVRRVLALKKDKDVFDAIKLYESSEPIQFLSEQVRPESGKDIVMEYPEGFCSLSSSNRHEIGLTGREALYYLLNRGVTLEQIDYYKIGFCGTGKYEKRIIVPVFNLDNNLVSFLARDFSGLAKAKVLTPAALPGTSGIKDYVFNLQNAIFTREFIIGEGVFDAMALGVSGIALFGKSATELQIQHILSARPLKIITCLDADAPEDNEKLAFRLSTYHPNVYMATLPTNDPASVSKEILDEALSSAIKFQGFPSVI